MKKSILSLRKVMFLALLGLNFSLTPLVAAAPFLELVSVGNAGNPADTTSYGAVSYAYTIGKYEVTLTQYTAFLNAVAKTDTYGLYNTSMATDLNVAGITRSGSSGSYTYAVVGSGNRPVTYVSWFDAARFTNWLANGQPTGAQGNTTTENGAYFLNGATTGTTRLTKNDLSSKTWTRKVGLVDLDRLFEGHRGLEA